MLRCLRDLHLTHPREDSPVTLGSVQVTSGFYPSVPAFSVVVPPVFLAAELSELFLVRVFSVVVTSKLCEFLPAIFFSLWVCHGCYVRNIELLRRLPSPSLSRTLSHRDHPSYHPEGSQTWCRHRCCPPFRSPGYYSWCPHRTNFSSQF